MEGATHFIEQWKSRDGYSRFSPIEHVTFLNYRLRETKNMGHKTIAIFYIKPKQK